LPLSFGTGLAGFTFSSELDEDEDGLAFLAGAAFFVAGVGLALSLKPSRPASASTSQQLPFWPEPQSPRDRRPLRTRRKSLLS